MNMYQRGYVEDWIGFVCSGAVIALNDVLRLVEKGANLSEYFIVTECGCDGTDVELYRNRPETDEEYNQRIARIEAKKRGAEEQERELYLKLKQKYEGQ
jgi:hypothetical protein